MRRAYGPHPGRPGEPQQPRRAGSARSATWLAGSVAGALLGRWLAIDLLGLAFTLTALFVVLAMDAVRVERDLPTPVLAFCCALFALVVAPRQMLVAGMSLFVGLLVVSSRLRKARGGDDA